MWRVAFVGLVIACGGATSDVRSESAEAARSSVPALEHEPTAERRQTDGLSTLAAAQATGPRAERDAIRDPREPRSALRTLLTEAHPEVRCADASRCPPSVGLVVFPGREPDLTGRIPPVRCTGTLVAPDRVLTASHCLTTPRCDDAWVAFPPTADHEAAVARCVWVLAQDPDTQDGVLLQDWALLQLERPLLRPVATLAPEAVREGTIVTVASVTPHPIYGSQHQLETRLCRAETPEAAEARLGAEARRVGWLSGCPIEPGNSGSPVLDAEGRLRALVHAGSHPVFGIGVTTALPPRLGH
ncbi:MAG: trypsin-like peptidase domain-containing protein [Sandaracinus sp.]|nr:trypsin-like peptidase domain-containing protein [Sandaracinus sp.]MCB9616162.1 trypsin-like peptidase domain-containing protein [Sandaracinus sp.]MCB9618046.1 trypsin-like peptidase domain-containing protein [Sandaracinus sp.]MCB9624065.1 trypsin-like peptidase domain-containing protein [Sandaracinus sp.]MCB9633578.1 trypsin-like peptidase domain-containing protein [Sandaracinus sp.]